MKKIVFLSCEDLLDVDLPVVQEIHEKFDFTWVIILRGYGWFKEEQLKDLAKENSINVIILNQTFKLKSLRTLLFHFKLLLLLKRLAPDVVYDSYQGTPWMHLFSHFYVRRSKFVIAIHDVVQHYNMHFRFIRKHYANFLMRNYKNIHVFSPSQLKLLQIKYNDKNILLAPLCLKDFGGVRSVPKNLKKNGQAKFLFFGIIRANKGVDLIIRTMNQIIKKYPQVSVTIAGRSEGSYWEEYEPMIENMDMFNLKIRSIEDYEIADLFNDHHFILLPYRDVTQSGVLLTSYNYAVPALASNLDGFKEYIIDEGTGFLFDNNDQSDFVNKLERIIQMDNATYMQMVSNLTTFVSKEISTKGISQKYVSFLNGIN